MPSRPCPVCGTDAHFVTGVPLHCDECGFDEANGPDRPDMRTFLRRWWPRYSDRVFPASAKTTSDDQDLRLPDSRHRAGVALLNLSRFILFPAGFLLVGWLLVDLFLPGMVGAATYARIDAVATPTVAIAAPAIVGYWTNYVAIKMLFRPRRPNLVWQGLIPQRKDELTQMMAAGIKERLISPQIIRRYLHDSGAVRKFLDRNVDALQGTIIDPRFKRDLIGLAHTLAEDYLNDPKTQAFVDDLIERFVTKARADGIKGKLLLWLAKRQKKDLKKFARDVVPQFANELDEILEGVDVLLEALPPRIEDHIDILEEGISDVIARALEELDVSKVIKGQLDQMDEAQLEEMLTKNIAQEIVFIQTAGGLFGLLVGLAVTIPVLRLPMLVVLPAAVWLVIVATTERPAPASVGDDDRSTENEAVER